MRLLLATSVLFLALAASAAALPDDLAFRACVGQEDGCTSEGLVAFPVAVAAAPGGRDVYLLSSGTQSVLHLTVDGETLTYADCAGANPACDTVPGAATSQPTDVVVTPDGRSVYAASYGSDAVLAFDRSATTGTLSYTGCIGNASGCTPSSPPGAMAGPLALAANNASVYVAVDGAVSHLRRNSNGSLTFAGCVGTVSGCTVTNLTAVNGADGLALDGDASHLYVAASSGQAISVFNRAANGDIGYQGCVGDSGDCTVPPVAGASQSPRDVIVSADGSRVVATSNPFGSPGAIVAYTRNQSTGAIAFQACTGSVSGCAAPTPSNVLDGVFSVAQTADGKLYSTTPQANALSRFSLVQTGTLFGGCSGTLTGCIDPGTPLSQPQDLAVLPDGKHVVVAVSGSSPAHSAVVLYRRRAALTCTDPVPVTTPDATAVEVTVSCTEPDGDPVTFVQGSAAAHGDVAQPANGTFRYTPATGYSGDDSFVVNATDHDGAAAVTVRVTVGAAPAAGQQPPPTGGGQPPATPPGRTPAVVRCVVPKLLKASLSTAKKRLKTAHCATGKIKKKRAPRHAKLVVVAQSPKAGKTLARGAKVKLTLGPKKKR